jgi:alpha-D-xyloside xylohydrolase
VNRAVNKVSLIIGAALGLAGCPAAPAPVAGDVLSDGTRVVLAGGDAFSIQILRDDVVVGATSVDPACPALSVGLRLPDDVDSWIDPALPGVFDRVELLKSTRATSVGDRATVILQDERGQTRLTATVVAKSSAEGFVDVDVTFVDDDGVALDERDVGFVAVCFAIGADHVVGGGERFDGPDLAGKLTPLVFSAPGNTESGTNEAHVPVPFFATTAGLGVLVETERVGAFDATGTGTLMARFHGASLPLRLRAARVRGDDAGHAEFVTDNVAAHARRLGLGKAPPRWALAPMQWRNDLEVEVDAAGAIVSSGTDMLLGDVAAMTARSLPFSTVWIDAPWETGYNTFVVNEVQLPNFDDSVATLTAHGLVPLVWATEHINTSDDRDQMVGMPAFGSQSLFERFAEDDFLVDTEDGTPFSFPWGRGTGAFVDFTNPAACAAWQDTIEPVLRRGVKGFKLDYGETMRPDVLGLVENTLPVFSDGSTNAVQHTRYARLYHECFIGALQRVHGDDWFIITRTGGIFDQKNGVAIWPGDLDADFSRLGDDVDGSGERQVGGLKSGIGGALSLAMSGYPLYGHDVGGYRGDRVTPEAFARFAEAGALQTIMQVGGGSNHAPWDDFLLDVEDAFASAVRLKMALWPMYEAGLARAMVAAGGSDDDVDSDGTPLMVPLGVFMGNDAEAWADPDAILLFDVLAAWPVVEDGARTRLVRVPAGEWLSLKTAERFTGPLTTTVAAPLGLPPMMLAAGAVLILDEASDTLLPVTAPGRRGPSSSRVVVTSVGPPSIQRAGGLVVRQTPDGAGLSVSVERAADAPITLRILGSFAAVTSDVGSVDDVVVAEGITEVSVGGSGDVVVRLQP